MKQSLIAAGAVHLILSTRLAFADDVFWVTGTTGNFGNSSNWDDQTNSTHKVPGSNDVVHFDYGPTSPAYFIGPILTSDDTNAGVVGSNYDARVNLNDHNWTLSNSTGYPLEVGVNSPDKSSLTLYSTNSSGGTFTLSGGAGATPVIGLSSGAAGTVNFGGYPGSYGSSSIYSITVNAGGVGAFQVGEQGNGTLIINLANVTVSTLSIGGGFTGAGTVLLSGGSLVSNGSQIVGVAGSGTFLQTAGTNTVGGANNTQSLFVGAGGNGYYEMYGSNTSANITGNEYVGYGSNGQVFQPGGTNLIDGALTIGTNGAGTYTLGNDALAGANLNTLGGINVGGSNGVGTFIQDQGGTNDVGASQVHVPLNVGIGGAGTYVLNDGTLSAYGGETIGGSGNTGTFLQNGGMNTINENYPLYVGSVGGTGYYTLGGPASPTLSVEGMEGVGYGGGTGYFEQAAGTNTVGTNLEAGTLIIGGSTANNESSSGTYSADGGNLNVYGLLAIGSGSYGLGEFVHTTGATVSILNGGSLAIGCNAGNGTYNMLGGTLNVTGSMYVGGLLATGNGTAGFGTFTQQSLSSVSILGGGSLDIGDAGKGFYNMVNGNLSVSGPEYVGALNNGAGTFLQQAGTHTASDGLSVGFADYGPTISSGFYSLASATLIVSGTLPNQGAESDPAHFPSGHTLFVGTGTFNMFAGATLQVNGDEDLKGQFNQMGGSNTATGEVDVGGEFFTGTAYVLSSGALNVGGNINIADFGAGVTDGGGTLTINGGTVNVAGTTDLGPVGTLSLNGGTLATNSLFIKQNDFLGDFAWSSGTLDITGGGFTVDSDTSVQSSDATLVNSLGANLTIARGMTLGAASFTVGNDHAGTLTQTGGLVFTLPGNGAMNIASLAGSTGDYSLSGTASATIGGNVYVGGSSAGAGGAGTLSVAPSANLSVGGTILVYGGGALNLSGGSVAAGTLNVSNAGAFTFSSGTLTTGGILTGGNPAKFLGDQTSTGWTGGALVLTNGLTVDSSSAANAYFGSQLTVNAKEALYPASLSVGSSGPGAVIVSGGTVGVAGTTQIYSNSSVSVIGGSFTSGSLNNAGTFSLNGVNATIGTGSSSLSISNAGTILLQNASINFLDPVDLPGTVISDPSTLTFNKGLTVDSTGVFQLGAGDKVVIASGNFVDNSTSTASTVAGATLAFTASGTQRLTLDSTASQMVWGALELGANTTLDVTGNVLKVNDLIVDGTTQPMSIPNVMVEGSSALNGPQTISSDTTNPEGTDVVFTSTTGGFTFSNNATYTNAGTFDNEADEPFSGTGTFTNTGTFRKQASGGTTAFSIPFNNNGLVDARSGTLSMQAGGSGTGSVTIESGATLAIGGSTFTSSGALDTEGNLNVTGTTATVGDITGAGTVYVTGGGTSTLNASSIDVGSLGLYYGDLGLTTAGSSSTVANASLNYANIVGSSPDGTTVQSDPSSLTVTGAFSNSISINLNKGMVLNLAGTGDIAGDNIAGDSNAAVNILPGAVITHNSTGSTYFQQPLTTIAGEYDVNAGALYIFNGGTHSGTINVASGATAGITGGFTSTSNIANSGTFTFINTPGPDTDPAVVYTGHTFNGNLTVANGATLGFDSIGTGGATFFSASSNVTVGSNATLNSLSGSTAVFNNPQAMSFGAVNIAGGVTFRNTSVSIGTLTTSGYVQIESAQAPSTNALRSQIANPAVATAGAVASISTLNMTGGIFRSGFEDNLPTTISVDTFNLSGGAVGAQVIVNKSMNWTGGNISDNYGDLVISPKATVTISQNGGQVSQSAQWDPRGTVIVQGNVSAGWDLVTEKSNAISLSQETPADDATPPTDSVINLTGKMNVSGAMGIGDGGTIDDAASTSKGTVNASGQSQLTATSIAVGGTSGAYGLFAISDQASVTTSSVQSAGTISQTGGTVSLGNVDGMTGTIESAGGKLGANYIRQHMLGASSGANVAIAANGTASGTSVLNALSIDSTSTVDLANNDLVLNHASGDTTSLASIKTAIHQAYDGGKWDQPGLTSSMAKTNAGYNLGYAEASDLGSTSFGGQTVGNAVLVMYTLNGDLNLTGSVDQNDIAKLAPNYGQAVSKGWSQGDVNGDGMVDQNDIALIAPNYGQSVSTSGSNAAVVANALVHANALTSSKATGQTTHALAVHADDAVYTWDAALAAPAAGTVLLKVDNTVGDAHYGDVILQGNSASLYTIDIQSASGNLNSKRYSSLSNQYENGTGDLDNIATDHTPTGTGLFSVFALSSTHINEAGLGISADFTSGAESLDLTNSVTSKGTGLFAGLANGQADLAFQWSGASGQLVDGAVEYSSPTPEPASGAVVLLAAGALMRRRRQR